MSKQLLMKAIPHHLKRFEAGLSPELTPANTGKVIIVNEKGEREVLEGIRFSNIDLNWYDNEGNLHPDFGKYHGKKFGMQFTLSDIDKEKKEYTHTNIFLAQMVLGEYGPTDWKHIWEGEKFEADLGILYGGFSDYDDPHVKDFISGCVASIVIFSAPGLGWADLKPAIAYISWAYWIDELTDNNVFFKTFKIPFCQISQVTDQMMEVCKGKLDPEEAEVDFEFPMIKTLCRYMLYSREQALLKCPTEEMFQRFVDGMRGYLNSVAISNCKEWNDFKASNKSGTANRAHWNIRRMDTGSIPTFDQMMMCYNNVLPQRIYESHLWQHFRSVAVDNIVFINDLMSYEKEVFEEETNNALIVRHHFEGMDFLEAFAKCVQDANKAAMDMMEIGNVLLKIFNNNYALKEAIYQVKAMTFGHINWYNYAYKYRAGAIFDQVIYMDDDIMMKQLHIE